MKRLLKNTSWLIVNQIFQMILSFFAGLLTVRYLGPSNYGSITYVASYISFFSSVCLMGLDTVVISKLVNYQKKDGEILASAIFLRVIFSIISMVILTLIVYVVDNGNKELVLIAVISSFELLFKCFGTLGFWYQYKLMSKKTAIADMISFFVATIFRIYILISSKSIYWFAAYNSLIYFLEGTSYIFLFKKDCNYRIRISFSLCKELCQACIPYLISGVMISLYSQMDRIMIKQMLNSTTEVGYYSVAYTISNLVAFIPNALSLSSRPVLMDMRRNNNPNYNKRITQTCAIIIWFSILYSLCITVCANFIVNFLYGESYLPAGSALKVLVWVTLFENITKIRDMWLISEQRSKYVSMFSILGTIMNIILNYELIPIYGITGAAIATVFTQMFVTVIAPSMFKETRQFSINALHAITLKNLNLHELFDEIIHAPKEGQHD